MYKQKQLKQHGQALVVIALAAVGLFAFAALAIDGSMVFSDRRHAQNAADTSVLDAALSKVRGGDWESNGLNRAASNGYDDNGATNEVTFYSPPVDGYYQGNDQYVQIKITSHVNTFFARVIGITQVTNRVEAVARATVPEVTSWFNGKALVSVMEGCKGGGSNNNHPFTVGGNGTTVVNNSGIFVNSSCSIAFVDNGNANLVLTDEGVCVVGGIQSGVTGVTPPPTGYCGSQIDPDQYQLPNPSCDQPGAITGANGNYQAWPGYFNTTGNKTFPDVSPSGTLKLNKGIYCLYNGISLNANWTLTTDLNDNGVHDPETEGVLLFVPKGDVTFNGGSHMFLHAISSTFDNFPADLLNYLIYVPPSNEANVTISGNSGSTFTGTILAPTSHCKLLGSGETFSLNAQVICYDTEITGDGTIDITFNQADGAVTTTQPGIELSE